MPPSRLDELEAVVRAGQDAFLAVGRALVEIRDLEVYREAGYASFGAYLADRFPELSRRSVYNALAAAAVADDLDGYELGPSHLVELARLSAADRRHMADLAAARNLSVRELRELIREIQRSSTPRRPAVLPDMGGVAGSLPDSCRLEVRDARTIALEDGDGHADRRHGAPCEGLDCPHPALVLESPPYDAGVNYDADPTRDTLPWRDYWYGLVVPHFREVYRVLMPGGRFACNLPNIVKADGEEFPRFIDPYVLAAWRRIGFIARERFTWVKVASEPSDEAISESNRDPRNTITKSTAWGTYCSPSDPVARAVSEPIYVASKTTRRRPPPTHANSESISRDRFLELSRNTWYVANNADRSRHPCPWPRGVPDNLIELYTWPGDLVANPFVGSGTTAESALELGRRFYGSDQSQIYVHDAERRAAAAIARLEGVQA